MSCGVGLRCGLDLALLWLWHRLAATAPVGPLAWELPYAMGVALKRQKKNMVNINSLTLKSLTSACLVPYIFLPLSVPVGAGCLQDLFHLWFWYCPDALRGWGLHSQAMEQLLLTSSQIWVIPLTRSFRADDFFQAPFRNRGRGWWDGGQIRPWDSLEKGSCSAEGRRGERQAWWKDACL